MTHAQRQTQSVAAHRIGFLGYSICIRKFARVARIPDVVFEDGRVRQVSLGPVRHRVNALTTISVPRFPGHVGPLSSDAAVKVLATVQQRAARLRVRNQRPRRYCLCRS